MTGHRTSRARARFATTLGATAAVTAGLLGTSLPAGAEETLTTVAKVNFQAEHAPVPAGFVKDFGQPYDANRGYGWVAKGSSTPQSMVGHGRDRNLITDQANDTLMHMQPAGAKEGRWEYKLPSGTYEITASFGDPAPHIDSVHSLRAEGQLFLDRFTPNAAKRFETVTVRLVVGDGRLTLNPANGTNTKINWVEIKRVGGSATTKPTTPPATEAPAPEDTTPPATEAPAPEDTTPPATEAPAPENTTPPTTEAPAPTTPPTTEAPAPTTPPVGGPSTVKPGVPWASRSAYDALGLFLDTGKQGIDVHEDWMGRDVKYRLLWAGWSTWDATKANFNSITDPQKGHLKGNDRTLVIAMGLTMKEGSSGGSQARAKLQAAANGANDAYWQWLGKTIHDRGLDVPYPDGRPKIILRVGWEHNGTWFPWSSKGNEELYAQAWRRAHDMVSRNAPDAVWAWGLSVNNSNETAVRASYPGDAYVDIIEMDVYDSWGFYPQLGGDADPARRAKTWQKKQTGAVGLDFLVRFAVERNKLFSIGETGLWREYHGTQYGHVGGGDNPDWFVNLGRWLDEQAATGRLTYVNYFEVDTLNGKQLHELRGPNAPRGSTAGSHFPKGAASFLRVFGNV